MDGSIFTGGDFGTVAIGTADQLPEGEIGAANVRPPTVPKPPQPIVGRFVDEITSDTAVMSYDAATGDVTIVAGQSLISVIEIVSRNEVFIGGEQFVFGVFDVASPHKFFRLNPDGFDRLTCLGFCLLD